MFLRTFISFIFLLCYLQYLFDKHTMDFSMPDRYKQMTMHAEFYVLILRFIWLVINGDNFATERPSALRHRFQFHRVIPQSRICACKRTCIAYSIKATNVQSDCIKLTSQSTRIGLKTEACTSWKWMLIKWMWQTWRHFFSFSVNKVIRQF